MPQRNQKALRGHPLISPTDVIVSLRFNVSFLLIGNCLLYSHLQNKLYIGIICFSENRIRSVFGLRLDLYSKKLGLCGVSSHKIIPFF